MSLIEPSIFPETGINRLYGAVLAKIIRSTGEYR